MSDITSQPPSAPQPSDITSQAPSGRPPDEARAGQRPADISLSRLRLQPRLRLWPGVAILVLLWLAVVLPSLYARGSMFQVFGMFFGPLVGTGLLLLWWLFASRLPWKDRLLVVLTYVVAAGVSLALYDESVGMVVVILRVLPIAATAWVGWLLVTPMLGWPIRRAGLLAVILAIWGGFALLRAEGVDGKMWVTLRGRWQVTDEALFLSNRPKTTQLTLTSLQLSPSDWPGFRGPNRDGRRTGLRIETDWDKHPPKKVWRHLVGPGWSSFAAVGPCVFTQEQIDADEAVVCYDANSGDIIWDYKYPARFYEQMAGAGPRATPTFSDGKIYAMGATGWLTCLDAVTGRKHWARDVVADSGCKVPIWGFAASPLVSQGLVTIFAGGPDGKSVVAYDAASGDLAWSAGEGEMSYCSLQPARLGGVDQLLITTDKGLTAFQPKTGKILWNYDWPINGMARCIQPAVLDDTDVLFGTGFGKGMRRLRITMDSNSPAEKLWETRAINPYFNDFVIHRGHLYGFDGDFFTCVSLEKGKSKWRDSAYGNGQVLLLVDQDLLLVLSEHGKVALVETNPDELKEIASFQALDPDQKTWNHPVVANGMLFVRNGAEAACYMLPVIAAADKQGKK